MKYGKIALATMLVAAVILAGCDKSIDSTVETGTGDLGEGELLSLQAAPWPASVMPPPGPQVTVEFGSESLHFWPYTGHDYSGDPSDPINLIFVGEADPLDIRAALMSLDGDRTAFELPPIPPFNSTWVDAIGDVQNTYADNCDWVPGSVQLACGDYEPLRFHLRLFKVGDWTVANAHFEIAIPGTTDHQVISWEAAEQFVAIDFMRSGLLDGTVPMALTDAINDAPFRTIPAMIYNELDEDLKGMIGGPPGDVTEDVPIGTDGSATILNLAGRVDPVPGMWVEDFVAEYNIIAPKPFCASGPYDLVEITGPVHLTQTVRLTEDGTYTSQFRASGELEVYSVDPSTFLTYGDPLNARVFELHSSLYNQRVQNAYSLKYQALKPFVAEGSGWYFERFRVGSRGGDSHQLIVRCAPMGAPTSGVIASAGTRDVSSEESISPIR
jgi:hypothetical protein